MKIFHLAVIPDHAGVIGWLMFVKVLSFREINKVSSLSILFHRVNEIPTNRNEKKSCEIQH